MNLSTTQYQLQGELTKCHLGKIMLQGELRSIKGYSFHVTKRPRMVIAVLPVSRNNYFILEGEYSGEMAPSMDIGSRQWACLSHRQEEILMGDFSVFLTECQNHSEREFCRASKNKNPDIT
jgi:hypothetical protein